MSATIAERVAAGAEWLDANRPGWVERIDIETLNLSDDCACVLGQEYGSFDDSPLVDRVIEAAEGGFFAALDAMDVGSVAEVDDEYDALTAEWRRLITARREPTS